MQEGMKLESGETCDPHQRRLIVDNDVANIRTGRLAARHGRSLYPSRRKCRRILLVEELAKHAIRKPLECNWTIAPVRAAILRNANIEVDYVRLCKLFPWVQYFI